MKKCITIHVLLGNIRPGFRYGKMQILWSFQASPLGPQSGLYHGTAGVFVAPPSTQMYCAMTDGHCMLCLRHDTRPRPRGKKGMMGEGAPLIGLPPQKLHSHHATVSDPLQSAQIHENATKMTLNPTPNVKCAKYPIVFES